MRRKQLTGSRYDDQLANALDENQNGIVDALTTPNPRIPENGGAAHRIVAAYPAYEHDAQPVQARGRIVWNKAYSFQPHGPSFLDPVPDEATVPYAK